MHIRGKARECFRQVKNCVWGDRLNWFILIYFFLLSVFVFLSRLCSVVSSLKGRGETVLNVRWVSKASTRSCRQLPLQLERLWCFYIETDRVLWFQSCQKRHSRMYAVKYWQEDSQSPQQYPGITLKLQLLHLQHFLPIKTASVTFQSHKLPIVTIL